MSYLILVNLFAVLDFINLAAGMIRIEYYHIKLSNSKLQFEYLTVWLCLFRFEKHNVFHHSL